LKHVSKPIAQGDPGIDEMKQRKLDGEQIFEMDHYAAELSQLGVSALSDKELARYLRQTRSVSSLSP
jgi:hypothetical protein